MTEEKNSKKISSTVNKDELIAGKSLNFYWQITKWFIVLLIVLEATNIIFDIATYSHWIIEALIFIIFNFWLLRIRRLEYHTALAASIFIGLGGGFGVALFEIIWYREFIYLLNLIRQPFIITVMGIVASFTFFLLFKNLLSNKDNNKSKGGGIYDRKQTNVNNRFR